MIASLKGYARVWAVAAVNGDLNRLKVLHGLLEGKFRAGDRLIYLGNYLGRGAASAELLDELLLVRRAFLARFGLLDSDLSLIHISEPTRPY